MMLLRTILVASPVNGLLPHIPNSKPETYQSGVSTHGNTMDSDSEKGMDSESAEAEQMPENFGGPPAFGKKPSFGDKKMVAAESINAESLIEFSQSTTEKMLREVEKGSDFQDNSLAGDSGMAIGEEAFLQKEKKEAKKGAKESSRKADENAAKPADQKQEGAKDASPGDQKSADYKQQEGNSFLKQGGYSDKYHYGVGYDNNFLLHKAYDHEKYNEKYEHDKGYPYYHYGGDGSFLKNGHPVDAWYPADGSFLEHGYYPAYRGFPASGSFLQAGGHDGYNEEKGWDWYNNEEIVYNLENGYYLGTAVNAAGAAADKHADALPEGVVPRDGSGETFLEQGKAIDGHTNGKVISAEETLVDRGRAVDETQNDESFLQRGRAVTEARDGNGKDGDHNDYDNDKSFLQERTQKAVVGGIMGMPSHPGMSMQMQPDNMAGMQLAGMQPPPPVMQPETTTTDETMSNQDPISNPEYEILKIEEEEDEDQPQPSETPTGLPDAAGTVANFKGFTASTPNEQQTKEKQQPWKEEGASSFADQTWNALATIGSVLGYAAPTPNPKPKYPPLPAPLRFPPVPSMPTPVGKTSSVKKRRKTKTDNSTPAVVKPPEPPINNLGPSGPKNQIPSSEWINHMSGRNVVVPDYSQNPDALWINWKGCTYCGGPVYNGVGMPDNSGDGMNSWQSSWGNNGGMIPDSDIMSRMMPRMGGWGKGWGGGVPMPGMGGWGQGWGGGMPMSAMEGWGTGWGGGMPMSAMGGWGKGWAGAMPMPGMGGWGKGWAGGMPMPGRGGWGKAGGKGGMPMSGKQSWGKGWGKEPTWGGEMPMGGMGKVWTKGWGKGMGGGMRGRGMGMGKGFGPSMSMTQMGMANYDAENLDQHHGSHSKVIAEVNSAELIENPFHGRSSSSDSPVKGHVNVVSGSASHVVSDSRHVLQEKGLIETADGFMEDNPAIGAENGSSGLEKPARKPADKKTAEETSKAAEDAELNVLDHDDEHDHHTGEHGWESVQSWEGDVGDQDPNYGWHAWRLHEEDWDGRQDASFLQSEDGWDGYYPDSVADQDGHQVTAMDARNQNADGIGAEATAGNASEHFTDKSFLEAVGAIHPQMGGRMQMRAGYGGMQAQQLMQSATGMMQPATGMMQSATGTRPNAIRSVGMLGRGMASPVAGTVGEAMLPGFQTNSPTMQARPNHLTNIGGGMSRGMSGGIAGLNEASASLYGGGKGSDDYLNQIVRDQMFRNQQAALGADQMGNQMGSMNQMERTMSNGQDMMINSQDMRNQAREMSGASSDADVASRVVMMNTGDGMNQAADLRQVANLPDFGRMDSGGEMSDTTMRNSEMSDPDTRSTVGADSTGRKRREFTRFSGRGNKNGNYNQFHTSRGGVSRGRVKRANAARSVARSGGSRKHGKIRKVADFDDKDDAESVERDYNDSGDGDVADSQDFEEGEEPQYDHGANSANDGDSVYGDSFMQTQAAARLPQTVQEQQQQQLLLEQQMLDQQLLNRQQQLSGQQLAPDGLVMQPGGIQMPGQLGGMADSPAELVQLGGMPQNFAGGNVGSMPAQPTQQDLDDESAFNALVIDTVLSKPTARPLILSPQRAVDVATELPASGASPPKKIQLLHMVTWCHECAMKSFDVNSQTQTLIRSGQHEVRGSTRRDEQVKFVRVKTGEAGGPTPEANMYFVATGNGFYQKLLPLQFRPGFDPQADLDGRNPAPLNVDLGGYRQFTPAWVADTINKAAQSRIAVDDDFQDQQHTINQINYIMGKLDPQVRQLQTAMSGSPTAGGVTVPKHLEQEMAATRNKLANIAQEHNEIAGKNVQLEEREGSLQRLQKSGDMLESKLEDNREHRKRVEEELREVKQQKADLAVKTQSLESKIAALVNQSNGIRAAIKGVHDAQGPAAMVQTTPPATSNAHSSGPQTEGAAPKNRPMTLYEAGI